MNLQVNDVLFRKDRCVGLEKVTVVKITPTGNIRVSDGSLLTPKLSKKTADAWDNTMYYNWSQELEDKHRLLVAQKTLNAKLNELKVFELDETLVNILLNALSEL